MQYPAEGEYAPPCGANIIFLNLSAHIEISILALVILPGKAVDDSGTLLSWRQNVLRELPCQVFGSRHTTNRSQTLHIDKEDEAATA